MTSEKLIQTAIDEGVFEQSSMGESIQINYNFRLSVNHMRDTFENRENTFIKREFESLQYSSEMAKIVSDIHTQNPNFVSRLYVIASLLDNYTFDKHVAIALSLNQIDQSVTDYGAPDPFLPIDSNHLCALSLYRRAILYVWNDKCEKSEALRKDFNRLFSNQIYEDIGLFAIYGPKNAKCLSDNYNIRMFPVNLFISNGVVESRLSGAPPIQVFQKEIKTFRNNTK